MRVVEAKFVSASTRAGHFPPGNLPEVAFAGRSNVGKSSLLNRLVGRHALARVSKTPGRTQQINFFGIDDRLVLVDLPGYGYARVPKPVQEEWRRLVESYLTTRRQLRAVVVIVDVRRGVEDDDRLLLDFLAAHDVAAILVATKVDKVGRGERRHLMDELEKQIPELGAIPFSSANGEGVAALWGSIAAATKGR